MPYDRLCEINRDDRMLQACSRLRPPGLNPRSTDAARSTAIQRTHRAARSRNISLGLI